MADWTDLHGDMLTMVGKFLTHVPDHLAFSAVCSSWRSVALDVRPFLPLSVPLLMLPGDADPNFQTRSYLSLTDCRIYEKKLAFSHNDVCIGSHSGWIVTIHENMDISLFNPFSGERLPLPPLTSLVDLEENCMVVDNHNFVDAAALSSSNIMDSPMNLTVMITQGDGRKLAFAKGGDSSWQIIDNDPFIFYTSIAFYKGKFYAVGDRGTVVCDLGPNPKVTLVAPGLPNDMSDGLLYCYKWYLVESLGELLIVARWIHVYDDEVDDNIYDGYDDDDGITLTFGLAGQVNIPQEKLGNNLQRYKTVFFTVYKLNFDREEWIQVKDLHNQAFFVGHNNAISMSSLDCEVCKGNCIYFTDDYMDGQESARLFKKTYHGYDMGVFDVADGSIKPLFTHGSEVYYPAPMWVMHRPW